MKITKDTTIGDVANKYPGAASIMLKYGLHCVGCSVNPFETIENGCLGHGMDESTINSLVDDLNKNFENAPEHKNDSEGKIISITDSAAEKFNYFMKEEKKVNFGIRLNVIIGDEDNLEYGLEFAERPNKNEEIVEEHGFKLFVDKNVVNMIKGLEIDYLNNEHGSGFKLTRTNLEAAGGCGTGCGCH